VGAILTPVFDHTKPASLKRALAEWSETHTSDETFTHLKHGRELAMLAACI
jgi:hypothetical protein